MTELLGESEASKFFDISYTKCPTSIRCNTIKISPTHLKKRLENYGWTVRHPIKTFNEIMTVENLKPGELGNTKEHLLGYYYVQEISSMLPILILNPTKNDHILDLCASPGSKTTQAAAMINNSGFILANDISIGRIQILNSNLERCGVMNTIVTRKEGLALCKKLQKKSNLLFDKILVDAPCSGEGTLRKSPRTFLMWNEKMIFNIAKTQKKLAVTALELLKIGGTMVYSTCTLAPEENEEIIDHLIKNFDIKLQTISLPIKFRNGITEWQGKTLNRECEKCLRLYPQDNNTDGFFVAKIKKISNKQLENEN